VPQFAGDNRLDAPEEIESHPLDNLSGPATQLRSSGQSQAQGEFCEPWVSLARLAEPRSGDREGPRLITDDRLSPLRGSITFRALTQGSESLAVGLTLTAATQLVEGSRQSRVATTRSVRRYG
jgi:hypothetical protein